MTPRSPQKLTQEKRLPQPQPTTSEPLSMTNTTTCCHHKTTSTTKNTRENSTKEHNSDINMVITTHNVRTPTKGYPKQIAAFRHRQSCSRTAIPQTTINHNGNKVPSITTTPAPTFTTYQTQAKCETTTTMPFLQKHLSDSRTWISLHRNTTHRIHPKYHRKYKLPPLGTRTNRTHINSQTNPTTHTKPSHPKQHRTTRTDIPVNLTLRKNIAMPQTSANPEKHKASHYPRQNLTRCRISRQRCAVVAKRTKQRKNQPRGNSASTNSTRISSYTKYGSYRTKPRHQTLEENLRTYGYEAQTEPLPYEPPRPCNSSSTTAYYSTQGRPPD